MALRGCRDSLKVFACSSLLALGCTRATPAPDRAEATASISHVAPERVRAPAVAGTFYPADTGELRTLVDTMLAEAKLEPIQGLRALVCPHAGYRFSGPIAASGFKQLTGRKFERVVVLAPSHRVAFSGVALPDADALRTPLGDIAVSKDASGLLSSALFVVDSAPHAREHALEVELPFLQRLLGQFELVPLVFGDVDEAAVAQHLERFVDARTFFVASSDLSHYYPYEVANRLDRETLSAITALDVDRARSREACGKSPILALMHLAKLRGWKARILDYRNSGDTTGDESRVVGYAAIAFYDGQ